MILLGNVLTKKFYELFIYLFRSSVTSFKLIERESDVRVRGSY